LFSNIASSHFDFLDKCYLSSGNWIDFQEIISKSVDREAPTTAMMISSTKDFSRPSAVRIGPALEIGQGLICVFDMRVYEQLAKQALYLI